MTVKFSSLKANLARENDGDWVPATSLPGVKFRVRALTYAPFVAKRDTAMRKLARQYGEDTPPDVIQSELGRLLAEEILLDWSGFDIAYSADAALEALEDPAFRDLRAAVEDCAIRLASVKVEFVEEQGKNSAKRSAHA